MKRVLALFAVLSIALWAVDIEDLNSDIQDSLSNKAVSIEAGRKRMKYDFIGSVRLSGSVNENKSDPQADFERTEQVSVNFSQDLFRSGGIIASMDYADLWAQTERIRLAQELNAHLQNLSTLLLQAKQAQIRHEQNALNLKNSEIRLLIKQIQYKAGDTDITQLNDAITAKNALLRTKLDLRNQLNNYAEEIAKISPISYENTPTPFFELTEGAEFQESNAAYLITRLQTQMARKQQTLTTSSFLPTLSASASFGRTYTELADRDSVSYGLTLSMPITFTSLSAVEEKKADKLRAQSDEIAAKQNALRTFNQSVLAISNIEGNIEILRENIELYDSLIAVTAAEVQTGALSRYDLETLENSRQADLLEIELNKLSVQIERAKLHYASYKGN